MTAVSTTPEGWTTRLYRRIMDPLIAQAKRRWLFLGSMVVLLLLACSLVAFKLVKVKMLPFDNKSEFQVMVDMPNGTTLEQTTRVAQELGQYLGKQPEVVNYQIYAGTSGPYNFNGLVRHYFLRHGANQADIQVNLLNQHQRSTQSHEIAKRLRPGLVEIGNKYGARLKVAEVPPGPPVLETLVAEVYGPDYQQQIELAKKIKQIFQIDARRGGRGLVRRRPAGEVRRQGGPRQGGAERRFRGGGGGDRARSDSTAQPRACCTIRSRAKTFPFACNWTAPGARPSSR